MKRILLIITLFSVLFLNACSESHILNIDSFIEIFNLESDYKISKAENKSIEQKDSIVSFIIFSDNITMTIKRNKETLNIMSISISSEKANDVFENIILSTIKSLDAANEDSIEAVNELLSYKNKEYANEMRTQKFISLFYTKTSVGNQFLITFNEEIETDSTVIPETDAVFPLSKINS